jgi:hypothetical protein
MADHPALSTPRQRLLEAQILDATVDHGPEADENEVNGPEEEDDNENDWREAGDAKEERRRKLLSEVSPPLLPPPPPVATSEDVLATYDSSFIDSLTVGLLVAMLSVCAVPCLFSTVLI